MDKQPHPMLKPLGVRIGLLLVCIGWTTFEAWSDPTSIWFWMFGAITVYAVYEFFVSPKYRNADVAPAERSDVASK